MSSLLDLDRFRATDLVRQPFDHLVVPNLLRAGAGAEIRNDFPKLGAPGLFPVDEVEGGPAFRKLIAEIQSPELRRVFGKKFHVDLDGKPLMVTVRGRARAGDGKIHVDTPAKLLTALIYFNEKWDEPAGRLRLLRGPGDVDDYFAEVPPDDGTLIAFRRTEKSWHGHTSFEGERRYVMFNFMTGKAVAAWETARHKASAFAKKLLRPRAA